MTIKNLAFTFIAALTANNAMAAEQVLAPQPPTADLTVWTTADGGRHVRVNGETLGIPTNAAERTFGCRIYTGKTVVIGDVVYDIMSTTKASGPTCADPRES